MLSAKWSDGLWFFLLGAGCGALSVFLLRNYPQVGTFAYVASIGLVVSEAALGNIVTFASFMIITMWVGFRANRRPADVV